MINNAIINKIRLGRNINADNAIIPTPKAHITCKTTVLKYILNENPKLITVTSKNNSHNPLVNRNFDKAFFPFLTPVKYAEVPARKTNTGAQK